MTIPRMIHTEVNSVFVVYFTVLYSLYFYTVTEMLINNVKSIQKRATCKCAQELTLRGN